MRGEALLIKRLTTARFCGDVHQHIHETQEIWTQIKRLLKAVLEPTASSVAGGMAPETRHSDATAAPPDAAQMAQRRLFQLAAVK
jgi:hypothetical protein